ncbi:carbohydrate ABC transporter permease [Cohnella sp. 56]|uniref:carbohydrate ABC transporter permease n=1 Tax=Cohnella sp. 56 TaxID=3113722 RepID=UPI0030E88C3C
MKMTLFLKTLWLLLLIAIALIMIYPFVFAFIAGLFPKDDFTNIGSMLPIPKRVVTDWYVGLFEPAMLRPFFNTFFRTAWYTLAVTGMAFLVGYVLERLRFPGRSFFFFFIIVIQMVPGVLTLIPTYILMAKIPFLGGNDWLGTGGHGLINNPLVLYVLIGPANIVWIYLFRQSISALPRDFEEAASIDGSGFYRTLFTVILPIQLPIIATIALNTAIGTWNDWLNPFMYVNKLEYTTLTGYVGLLVSALSKFGDRNYPLIFAASTVATLPPLIIFLFMQKYIVQGFANAGIKG